MKTLIQIPIRFTPQFGNSCESLLISTVHDSSMMTVATPYLLFLVEKPIKHCYQSLDFEFVVSAHYNRKKNWIFPFICRIVQFKLTQNKREYNISLIQHIDFVIISISLLINSKINESNMCWLPKWNRLSIKVPNSIATWFIM